MSDIIEDHPTDRRVTRTRSALRLAFNRLILTKGYHALTAADVAEQANVGRSTFYEHYRGKEDLLAQSLVPILEPLADTCIADDVSPSLVGIVEHMWASRKLAHALLADRARGVMTQQLSQLIEDRLDAADLCSRLLLPKAIAAHQLANGQLAIIEAWVTGRHGCSAVEIASALHLVSRSVVQALALKQAQA